MSTKTITKYSISHNINGTYDITIYFKEGGKDTQRNISLNEMNYLLKIMRYSTEIKYDTDLKKLGADNPVLFQRSLTKLPCTPFSSSEDHIRLRKADWHDPKIELALKNSNSSIQYIQDSFKNVKYDQYSVKVAKMPVGLTPEQYLSDMSNDLNKAINNDEFNRVNIFKKRSSNTTYPEIGTIYDIDILGPDNGSVILVEKTSSSFTFQTIITPFSQTGSHPEAGARLFGFKRNSDGSITFYTKGVSQADIGISDPIGQYFQGVGWTALMNGISNEINRRHGSSDPSTISIKRCDQDERT